MIRLFLLAALILTGCGADDSEQQTEQPEQCDEIPHYYLTGEQPLTCAELRALINSGD